MKPFLESKTIWFNILALLIERLTVELETMRADQYYVGNVLARLQGEEFTGSDADRDQLSQILSGRDGLTGEGKDQIGALEPGGLGRRPLAHRIHHLEPLTSSKE